MAVLPFVEGSSTAVAKIISALLGQLTAIWSDFDGWYDDSQVAAAVADSVKAVESAQNEARRQVISFQKNVYKDMGLDFPDVRAETGDYPRFDVAPEEVWARPAENFRYLMSTGKSEESARSVVMDRIEAMADSEVQLARRDQATRIYSATKDQGEAESDEYWPDADEDVPEEYWPDLDEPDEPKKPVGESKSQKTARKRAEQAKKKLPEPKRVKAKGASRGILGYRRVLHPELADSGQSCGLCVAAATRLYRTDELLPIHRGCHCETLPVTRFNDPGLDLNQDDLARLYEAAGSTSAADLSSIRLQTFVSGELGPVLTRAGKKVAAGETRKKRELSGRDSKYSVSGSKAKDASRPRTEASPNELKVRVASLQKMVEDLKRNGDNDVRIKAAERTLKYYQNLLKTAKKAA